MSSYYIATAANGGDDENTGLVGQPWLTLIHACDTATTAGDVINVGVGTFTEIYQSTLAAGVSIVGAGATSIIESNVAGDWLILMSSVSEGTDGNQTISNLKFDGDSLTGGRVIQIIRRSNVIIHDCTFQNFLEYGVMFQGKGSDGEPTTYATGNQFYNNTVTNCSLYNEYSRGGLLIGGQDGMLIYGNTFNETARGGGADGNGDPITFCDLGYLKNVKIHDNDFTVVEENGIWGIELWNGTGENEIYDNTITGGGGTNWDTCSKGALTYALKIYNNTITNPSQAAYYKSGVSFDGSNSDVYVYNNYIQNKAVPIYIYLRAPEVKDGEYLILDNINIYNNIIDGVGTVADGGRGIELEQSADMTSHLSNINIWNNTIYQRYSQADAGIHLVISGTGTNWNNFNIQNNIIELNGASSYGIVTYSGGVNAAIDTVAITNNNTHGSAITDNVTLNVTPTNLTNANNITTDPLFISASDFHLQSGSPCIDTGLTIAEVTDDYDGIPRPLGQEFDIGAYGYYYGGGSGGGLYFTRAFR